MTARLVAIEEILRLQARCCRLLDAGGWEAARGLLALGADLGSLGGLATPGPGARTLHLVQLPEIDVTGESTARATWSLVRLADGPGRLDGHLEATYRREDGSWRIAALRVEPLRQDSAGGPPPVPPDGWLDHPREELPAGRPLDLAALADIEAIRQLKARYSRLMDTKRWAEWRGLYTDSARFDVPGVPGDISSPDGWVAGCRENLDPAITGHAAQMPEIALTDDGAAQALWAFHDDVELGGGGGGAGGQVTGYGVAAWRGFGHYRERYERSDDGWRIAHIRLSYVALGPPEGRSRIDPGPGPGSCWLPQGGLPGPGQLAALEEIRRLKARALRLLDRKLWQELRGVYLDQSLPAALERDLAGAVTVHRAHMPEIRFTDEGVARAIWSAETDVERAPGDRRRGIGYWHDEYRTDADGSWQIASSQLALLRHDRVTGAGEA